MFKIFIIYIKKKLIFLVNNLQVKELVDTEKKYQVIAIYIYTYTEIKLAYHT